MLLEVKIVPQSQENSIVEFKEGVLKIKIKGTPIKGKVNDNLIKFLAKIFDVSKSDIKIVSGLINPRKRIEIAGLKITLLEILTEMKIPFH